LEKCQESEEQNFFRYIYQITLTKIFLPLLLAFLSPKKLKDSNLRVNKKTRAGISSLKNEVVPAHKTKPTYGKQAHYVQTVVLKND